MSQLLHELNKIPGFKISQSHFKIGTKLHLSDFYYAKLYFQNSFYSSRFAYLISSAINKDIADSEWEDIKNTGLTIVGYGLYAEFMLSLVHRFISKTRNFDSRKINFNIVLESSEMGFMKQEPLHNHAIIIIPIACTLSTSIKVEQFLNESAKTQNKNIQVSSFHYNLLHVCEDNNDTVLSTLETSFEWVEKDPVNKIIKVKALFDGLIKSSRYFIKLPSIWSQPQECRHCFPNPGTLAFPYEELPLLETDRTSLLPRIIFDHPEGKVINQEVIDRKFKLTPRMIKYSPGSLKGHFLYQIDLTLFLQENEEQVIKWLESIRLSDKFKSEIDNYSHIIILAPAQSHNTNFLMLVNEYLFSSSGNIIHYDPVNDYVQNFQNLYGKELREADKVVFVNDSLSSAQHFFKLNELFRQACRNDPRGENTERCIDLAVILLDQTPSIVQGAVLDRLGKKLGLQCFQQLNLFTSVSLEDPPLAVHYERFYENLATDSLLDSAKVHFLEQRDKFIPNNKEINSTRDLERHWWMVRATHNLYAFFRNKKGVDLNNIEFVEFFRQYKQTQYFNNTYHPPQILNDEKEFLTEEKAAVLKVLTHIPFTQYGPVLKLTFRWVITLLRTHKVTLKNKLLERPDSLTIQDFNWLKFLLRRAGLLNINYIISTEFIQFLDSFFSIGIPTLIKNMELKLEQTKDFNNPGQIKAQEDDNARDVALLNQFHIFFAAQVKLLLFNNEQRSIYLETNISNVNITNLAFRQQLRVLQDENTSVINRFCEMLQSRKEWEGLDIEKQKHPAESDVKHPLKLLLNQEDVFGHQHHSSLRLFFEKSKEQINGAFVSENPLFLNYLWLLHFIRYENKSEKTIIEKIKFIFERIKNLIEFNTSTSEVTEKTGVFLLVKNYKNDLSLVYELYEEKPLLEQYFWRNGDEIFLQNFLEGNLAPSLKFNKTIIELYRPSPGESWQDLYSTSVKNNVTGLSPHFLPGKLNHLLLIRLNKRERDKDNELGLLGIYFEKSSDAITEINRVRYLLLMREYLINFVESHLRSNEFLELQEAAQAKGMILLAGHGREMIINLAAKYDGEKGKIYKSIATSLGQIQHIMTLLKYSDSGKGYAAMIGGLYDIYHVKGNQDISNEFVHRIHQMAIEIFEFQEIETLVLMEPDFTIDPVNFPFNQQLLEIIFFEILVNAKKNRWHFLEGAPIPAGFENRKNKVSIKVFEEYGYLKIEVSNSGPEVSLDKMRELKIVSQHGKPPNLTSGTRLIKHLISGILKDEILFSNNQYDGQNDGMSTFKVCIRLRPMSKNELKEDFINRQPI